VKLLVLTPSPGHQRSAEAAARLREAGANDVTYGLRETSELLLGGAAPNPLHRTGTSGAPAHSSSAKSSARVIDTA
jgi:hypothetical protein